MSPILLSLIVFACVFGSALLGIFLHFRLPDHHLLPDSRDAVRLVMGLVTTMVALALGLLVGSAKGFYDTQNAEIAQLATNAVVLDRLLVHYGPEADSVRGTLRTAVSNFSPLERSENAVQNIAAQSTKPEALLDAIQELSPKNDTQRSLQNYAVGIAVQIGQMRWLMFEQRMVSFPAILLIILIFWLAALFVSFGLFVRPNGTLVAGLFVAALAVSAAIFLITEMYHPYTGVIHVSDAPIRSALLELDH